MGWAKCRSVPGSGMGPIRAGSMTFGGSFSCFPRRANFGPLRRLRPSPPERAAEVAEVKNFKRTPITNGKVFYWQFGQYAGPGLIHRLERRGRPATGRVGPRPQRAASRARLRAGACGPLRWLDRLAGREVPLLDGASQSVRPDHHHGRPEPQLPNLRVERGDPRHGADAVLSHLFPREAARYQSLAQEFGESRLWAGIHFRSDIEAGLRLVAGWARR